MTNANILILKVIKAKEEIARTKYKHNMGWVPIHTNSNTIIQTVIQLIHKRNCTGFLKLIEVGAPELTLEYTAIEFSEKFPNLFPVNNPGPNGPRASLVLKATCFLQLWL